MSSRIAVRRKRRRAEVTMGGRIAVALGCLLFSVAGVSAEPAFVEAARLQGLRGVDPREVVLFPAAGSAWVAFAAGGAVHARRIPGQGTTPGAPVADLTEPAVWTSDRPDGTVRLLGAYGTAGRSPWLCFVEDHPGGSTLWLAPRPYVRRGRPGAYAVDRDDVTGRIDAYWVYQESQGRATIVYLREGALHGVLVSADGRVHGASSLSVAEEAVLHLELVTTVGGESVRHEGFYTAGLRDGGFVTRAILLEGGAVVAGEVVAQGVRMPQVRLASFTPVRRGLLVQTDRSLRRFWWAGTVLRGAGTRELPRAATAITASDGTAGAAVVAAGEDRVWLLSDRGIAAEIPGSLAAGPAWTVPGEGVRLVVSRRASGGRFLVLQDLRVAESPEAGLREGPYEHVAATRLVGGERGVWVVGVGAAGGEHRLVWSDMGRPGWSRGAPVAREPRAGAQSGAGVVIQWAAAAGRCLLAAVDGVVICADVDTGETAWYLPRGRAVPASLPGGTYLVDSAPREIVVLRIREESE